ncbi:hypothetical protein ACFQY7_43725 [Actinomadura luteofluorescens]|uniref:hypothetical protein n=1 Tax=Actinomadura luteofluorescens TaxID=46163 RepID=UPI003628C8AB
MVDQVAFQPLRSRGGEQLLGTIITSVALWIALREVASLATGAAPSASRPARCRAASCTSAGSGC